VTGELLDRFRISPRMVTIGIGLFFVLPGVAWFLTQRWWDRENVSLARDKIEERKDLSVIHQSIE
jgi:hypothetical protein